MPYSEKMIQLIWEAANHAGSSDPAMYRKDCVGAWIKRDQYSQEGNYGWGIDHVYPLSKGGKDDSPNIRAMHWENNRSKADDYPHYRSAVIAEKNQNVRREDECTVPEDLQIKLRVLYGAH